MEEDSNVRQWRIKKLIQRLRDARGNGTSMISLILRPGDQIARCSKMLAEEAGTAGNIKNRVNRQSVLEAIDSARQALKRYLKVPLNGLILFCGKILLEDGKEKSVTIDFEPHKPINTSLYLCDNKFHTEALEELLENDDRFGFIVFDGEGALFAVLSGNSREILQKISLDLPNKQRKGGQSALRFQRLGAEARQNAVTKVAELSIKHFMDSEKVNVAGLVLAGSAQLKNKLLESDLFSRLKPSVLQVIDTAYGKEAGLNQAINLSVDTLHGLRFTQEKRLLERFFGEINKDSGLYCFGFKETLQALEGGAIETLIAYEGLELMYSPEESLLDWLVENHQKKGCRLELVSSRSEEGERFLQGFGGVGGLLRYPIDVEEPSEEASSSDDYTDFY